MVILAFTVRFCQGALLARVEGVASWQMDLNEGETIRIHVGRDNLGSLLSQSKIESPTPCHVERNLTDEKIDCEGGTSHPSHT